MSLATTEKTCVLLFFLQIRGWPIYQQNQQNLISSELFKTPNIGLKKRGKKKKDKNGLEWSFKNLKIPNRTRENNFISTKKLNLSFNLKINK